MGCIDTYYNLVKNTMTSDAEQLIEYGQRELIDWEKSWKTLVIMWYTI